MNPIMPTCFTGRFGNSLAEISRFILPILLLASLTFSASGQGASASAVSPAVLDLYSQAKAAQAQGDEATAIQKYQAILHLAPRLAAGYNNLGMLYINQRDYPKAVDILTQGLKVNPSMPSASALLGSALYSMGQYQKAKAPLESALRATPKDSHVEITLARVLINSKAFEPAVEHLRNVVAREPENQEAWYLLGKSELQLSETALAKVIAIDPNSVLSHIITGELDESMNNLDGAIVEYKKAVDMAPQQLGNHFHLANALWNMGKWDSAREEFQAELVNDPSNCQAMWKMANSLLEKNGPPDQALPDLDHAVAVCPELMQARVDRGRALIKLGRAPEALPDLLMAEKAAPEESSIHFQLAAAYRALGQTGDAQTEMRSYAALQRKESSATAQRATETMNLKEQVH
jgi:tetratricopeptide (TPR) repeat protein